MKITRIAATAALTGALLLPGAASAAPSPSLTPEAIDAFAREQLDASGLPGLSLVVTRDGEVVHAAGYGEGISADSPMRVASVSKSFTALAVLELAEDGRVALDAPLAAQLPGFAMDDPRAAAITPRHLLNQTSGISDTGVDIADANAAPDLASFVDRLADDHLVADPGAGFAYTNVNYDLLARLIEVASGRSYPEYMAAEVFGPLGMTGTAVTREAPPGHIHLFGTWPRAGELFEKRYLGGSGDVVTTAADMGRWLIMQSGHGPALIAPESLALMHTPAPGTDYAMGWGVNPDGTLEHAGNLFTYTADQLIDPETGLGIAVMANSSAIYDESHVVVDGLRALAEGRAPETGGGLWTTELVIAALLLAAAGLGVLGVLRSRRWAGRAKRKALRLSPLVLPVALLAAYPSLLELLMRRDVTWAQCWYRAPSVMLLLITGAAAALAVAAARVARVAFRR
ncbi:serine hydrolase [Actinorhabdospora filicis]|uniref:Serine hydrolase n=1 Tax=Actinorhabdospora filicis TaxID=1785913 RepID=A0A9W6SKI3_9ACTN|nr:serine hydrolase domain-containing protein [Actinorhabdospora filicis]GLZ76286.1 serine hydrolase [Actinorhabdospora filicis]